MLGIMQKSSQLFGARHYANAENDQPVTSSGQHKTCCRLREDFSGNLPSVEKHLLRCSSFQVWHISVALNSITYTNLVAESLMKVVGYFLTTSIIFVEMSLSCTQDKTRLLLRKQFLSSTGCVPLAFSVLTSWFFEARFFFVVSREHVKEKHWKEKEPEKQMVWTDSDSYLHESICWCPVVLTFCSRELGRNGKVSASWLLARCSEGARVGRGVAGSRAVPFSPGELDPSPLHLKAR